MEPCGGGRSLLSGAMCRIATKSRLHISGIAITGGVLHGTTANTWKDFFVRANLVVSDTTVVGWTDAEGEAEPTALKVEPDVTAKSSSKPNVWSLDWGNEGLTLELPGPAQLPIFVQLVVRAKDALNSAVMVGHALMVVRNIAGDFSVKLLEEDLAQQRVPSLSSLPPSPPPSTWSPSSSEPVCMAHAYHMTRPPPSPPPSPSSASVRPAHSAPPMRSLGLATEVEAKDYGTGESGNTRPASSDGRSGGALAPLSAQQAGSLLRKEIIHHEDRVAAERHEAHAHQSASVGGTMMRLTYSVTVPFPPPASDFTKRREKRQNGACRESAVTRCLDYADDVTTKRTSGRDDGNGGEIGASSRNAPLGCFCSPALYDGPACLRMMIKARCDANATDLVKASPLHKATAMGDVRALRLLIGCGANVDAPNIYGDTSLHRAVENLRLRTVTELCRHGADVDRPNNHGNTPLHLACAVGSLILLRALLGAGAVVMNTNLKGMVPLHTAIHFGQRKVVEALITHHSNRRLAWQTLLVAKTKDTPLHVAARALHVSDFIWMVELGGFSQSLVLKNVYNHDPLKLLREAKKRT